LIRFRQKSKSCIPKRSPTRLREKVNIWS